MCVCMWQKKFLLQNATNHTLYGGCVLHGYVLAPMPNRKRRDSANKKKNRYKKKWFTCRQNGRQSAICFTTDIIRKRKIAAAATNNKKSVAWSQISGREKEENYLTCAVCMWAHRASTIKSEELMKLYLMFGMANDSCNVNAPWYYNTNRSERKKKQLEELAQKNYGRINDIQETKPTTHPEKSPSAPANRRQLCLWCLCISDSSTVFFFSSKKRVLFHIRVSFERVLFSCWASPLSAFHESQRCA